MSASATAPQMDLSQPQPGANPIHPFQHPYPDLYNPSAPYPLFKLHPLFEQGRLNNPKGESVSWEELRGKSVALYFGDWSLQKCKSFLPFLTHTYRTLNESGDTQKVEIIFVSLDGTREQFEEHRKRQPWLSLDYGDPLIEMFKQHYRVMRASELPKYGFGPRTGPPALLVISSDGRLLQNMEVEEHGPGILRKWDMMSLRF